ncbi:MAG: hypothetical protein ACJ79S_21405 [Gemmatimonadaceae bacterium]
MSHFPLHAIGDSSPEPGRAADAAMGGQGGGNAGGGPPPRTFGSIQHDVATIDVEGRDVAVAVRIVHDGVEYVGRLWFADPGSSDPELVAGIPDRAPLPGRTREDVLARALCLDPDDLVLRHERALVERRRYRALRHTTDEVLARIRYLNRVALLVRDGLLDRAGGEQELDITEKQLHELVSELRAHAGLEA